MATSTIKDQDATPDPTPPENPASDSAKTETPVVEPAKTPAKGTRTRVKANEGSTTLDSDVTKPSVTAPGDGPADTTDPTERAQSVPPQPGAEALAAGTVNAVKPVPKPRAKANAKKDRTETYPAILADGKEVTVLRNIDTGATEIVSGAS